jgi:hypothetical protein
MADKNKDALRRELGGAQAPPAIAELEDGEAGILLKGLRAAQAREQTALDAAIDGSLAMVPFLLRGAFKKILFP